MQTHRIKFVWPFVNSVVVDNILCLTIEALNIRGYHWHNPGRQKNWVFFWNLRGEVVYATRMLEKNRKDEEKRCGLEKVGGWGMRRRHKIGRHVISPRRTSSGMSLFFSSAYIYIYTYTYTLDYWLGKNKPNIKLECSIKMREKYKIYWNLKRLASLYERCIHMNRVKTKCL